MTDEEHSVSGILGVMIRSFHRCFRIENPASGWLHSIFYTEDRLFALLLKRGQFEAVLSSEQIENRSAL
jgi:hypothetical protein